MCRTWNFNYSCGHKFDFRLSKCRATVYTQSRPGRPLRPACMGSAALVFKKAYPCGDCALKEREQELSEFKNKLEEGSEERQAAEAEFLEKLFKAEKSFPIIERFKKPRPLDKCHLAPKQMRGSLLKQEVFEEDVKSKDHSESWTDYYDEWNSTGWTSSSDTTDTTEETSIWDSSYDEPYGDTDEISLPSSYCTPYYDYWSYVSACVRQWELDQEEPASKANDRRDQDSDDEPEVGGSSQGAIQDITNDSNAAASEDESTPDTKTSNCKGATDADTQPTTDVALFHTKASENHKFNTTPPHLRKQKAIRYNQPSASNYTEPEPFDVLERQFKSFTQYQSVMVVSI